MTEPLMCLFRALIRLSFLFIVNARIKLDDALANDIFPATSNLCNDGGTGGDTSFDFTFSQSPSFFYPAEHESEVFQVEMHHQDKNENRTWTMRIGKGGQVYSFIGAFGEMIPPQSIRDAWWVDTVTQTVAVNMDLNKPNEGKHYFVHQAGTYNRDTNYTPPAFYSPMLALHCEGPSCSQVSWGQQAHIPTDYKSHVLYWTQYRDCGDGMIQYEQAVYNFNREDPTDVLNYFNIPWQGIRQSTLNDLLISDSSGELQHMFPMQQFASSRTDLENFPKLKDTGGFVSLAQDLETPDDAGFLELPCVNGIKEVRCDEDDNAYPLPLVVRGNNTAVKDKAWSERLSDFGIDLVVRLEFHDPATFLPASIPGLGNNGAPDGLIFTNHRTGYQVLVLQVIQWVWESKWAIFSVNNVTLDEMNREFLDGDSIAVTFAQGGMSAQDNLAMTFVTGKNVEFEDPVNTWWNAHSRIRYGAVPARERDLSIFTVNLFADIEPTDTYLNRQFFITDQLSQVETRAPPLVDETIQSRVEIDDHMGRKVTLYYNDDDGIFGAAVDTDSCPTASGVACTGSTTPQPGADPLFYVTCGANEMYVGNDPYYFSPAGLPARSYVCNTEVGGGTMIRPQWKLLGFFVPGSCNVISRRHSYQEDFCEQTSEAPRTISRNDFIEVSNMVETAILNSTCLYNVADHWDWDETIRDCIHFPLARKAFPLASLLVRHAFHDAIGNPDAFVDFESPFNNGLQASQLMLDDLYANQFLSDGTPVSKALEKADFYAWAYMAALQFTVKQLPGGRNVELNLTVRVGRVTYKDDDGAPFPQESEPASNPHSFGGVQTMNIFRSKFGFNESETTTLMGAHTLGRAMPETSGFVGTWAANTNQLSNDYYRNLLDPRDRCRTSTRILLQKQRTPRRKNHRRRNGGGKNLRKKRRKQSHQMKKQNIFKRKRNPGGARVSGRCMGWEQVPIPNNNAADETTKFEWRHSCDSNGNGCRDLMLNSDMALLIDFDDYINSVTGEVSLPTNPPIQPGCGEPDSASGQMRILASCFPARSSGETTPAGKVHFFRDKNNEGAFISQFADLFDRMISSVPGGMSSLKVVVAVE